MNRTVPFQCKYTLDLLVYQADNSNSTSTHRIKDDISYFKSTHNYWEKMLMLKATRSMPIPSGVDARS